MLLLIKLLLCVVIAPTFLSYSIEQNIERFPSTDSQTLEESRAAVTDENMLWTDGIIYYEIDKRFKYTIYYDDLLSVLLEATKMIENHTCLKFKEWDEEHPDYIHIIDGDECYSQVGRKGGRQVLTLGNGCIYLQVVLYQLMRVIGFYNEMNRNDRDDYIEIRRTRVNPAYSNEFRKMESQEYIHLDTDFDFDSIMMYTAIIYSHIANLAVALPHNSDITVNYKNMTLSSTDIIRVNRLYECFGETRPLPSLGPFFCDFGYSTTCNNCNMKPVIQKPEKDSWYTVMGRKQTLSGDHTSGKSCYYILDHNSDFISDLIFAPLPKVRSCLSFYCHIAGNRTELTVVGITTARQENELLSLTESEPGEWKEISIDKDPTIAEIKLVMNIKDTNKFLIAIDDVKFELNTCNQ